MKFVDLMSHNNRWGGFSILTIHLYDTGAKLSRRSLEIIYSEIPVDFYNCTVRWFNNDEVGIEV